MIVAEQPGVYDCIIINDDLDKAYGSLKSYLERVCGSVFFCTVFTLFD